ALLYTAAIYTKTKQDPTTGLAYFRKSYRVYSTLNHQEVKWVSNWLNNMGASFFLQGTTDSAVFYYKKALNQSLHSKLPLKSIITTYNNLGNLLLSLRQFEKARYYLRQSEK